MDAAAVLVAALALVGVLATALVTGAVALVLDLRRTRKESRLVWMWARDLVDQVYRGEGPPPREPPAGLTTIMSS